MPLLVFENQVFILTKYANIQKNIPSIFISSTHKLILALIIITLLMITILGLILLKVKKISNKINKTPTRIELTQKNSSKLSDKTFTDRLDFRLLILPFFHFIYTPFFI